MSDIRMGSRAVIDSPAQRAAAVGNADAEADRFAASEETEPPNIATQPSHEVSNYLAVSRKYPPKRIETGQRLPPPLPRRAQPQHSARSGSSTLPPQPPNIQTIHPRSQQGHL
jgi:hypothetical protein